MEASTLHGKDIIQGRTAGQQKRERLDNITAWIGLPMESALHVAGDCNGWGRRVCDAANRQIEDDLRKTRMMLL